MEPGEPRSEEPDAARSARGLRAASRSARVLCSSQLLRWGREGGEGGEKGRKDVGGERKGAEDSRESGQPPAGCPCCRLSPPSPPPARARSWLGTTCTAFFKKSVFAMQNLPSRILIQMAWEGHKGAHTLKGAS